MENKIEVFQNEQFGAVRITLIDGEPWFAASDVCKALEIKNARGIDVSTVFEAKRDVQKKAKIFFKETPKN